MEYSTDLLNALVLISNYVLIPAISYGSQLALGAVGVTLVFGILRFANFAHGEMMAFGCMATIFITWWFQSMGISSGVFPTALLALPFAILITALLAVAIDRSKPTGDFCGGIRRCDVYAERLGPDPDWYRRNYLPGRSKIFNQSRCLQKNDWIE